MRIPPELVCLGVPFLTAALGAFDMTHTSQRFVACVRVVDVSHDAITAEDDNHNCGTYRLVNHTLRPNDRVRLYEVWGVLGRYGWAVGRDAK